MSLLSTLEALEANLLNKLKEATEDAADLLRTRQEKLWELKAEAGNLFETALTLPDGIANEQEAADLLLGYLNHTVDLDRLKDVVVHAIHTVDNRKTDFCDFYAALYLIGEEGHKVLYYYLKRLWSNEPAVWVSSAVAVTAFYRREGGTL